MHAYARWHFVFAENKECAESASFAGCGTIAMSSVVVLEAGQRRLGHVTLTMDKDDLSL